MNRTMCFFLGAIFIGLCGFSHVAGDTPGFRSTVSQNGLSYLKDVGLQLLEKQLATLSIPNQSGSAGTPIGNIDWDLTNIVLNSFSIGSSALKTVPNEGIAIGLSSVSCSISMDWHYRESGWPHVSDSGSADVTASQVSAAVVVDISSSNGKLVVNVGSDSVNVGDLDITLHGGASWLYNFFVNVLSNNIKNALDTALTNAITQNIDNGLNVALSSLPVTIPINHQVEISYSITANPDFTVNYLEVPMLGEFYAIASPTECPGSVCPHYSSPESVTSQMLQMIITDYVANSAGEVFFNLNELKATIQDKDIPSWSPIRLNTSSFEYLIPALYAKYPNQLLQLNVYATSAPNAVFNAQGAIVKASGNLDMMVVTPQNTLVNAFTLNGTVNTAGIAILNGDMIYGNLSYIDGTFGLLSSNIGNFDVSLLNQLLALMMSQGIVPGINTYLKNGFQLPTVQGLTFNNPSVQWGDHFLTVSTDVTYVPPANAHQPGKFAIEIN